MNWPLLIAGILLFLATVVHTIAGELTNIRHLLGSDVPENEKIELRGIWHGVSLLLAGATAITLYATFVGMSPELGTLIRGLAIYFVLFSVTLIPIILASDQTYLLKVPQWLLLLVIGLLMWWGANH